MTDYKPVDCVQHSEYEVAILHRSRLRLTWRDASGIVHIEALCPVDLHTRRGEEFLVASARDGSHREIRLDRILHCKPA